MSVFNPYLIDEAETILTSDGIPFSQTFAGAEVINMARAYAALQTETVDKPGMPVGKFIARKEDMSLNGRLRLIKQDDGDICVAVINEQGESASVEFCVMGMGGGKSPRTLAALNELALAIIADNEEDPSRAAVR